MIRYLRLLLFPFSLIYGLVTVIRNLFYDWGIFRSVHFDIPVICVGNLVVGGSGKTPVTEYLVRLLQGRRIAILSRGYGRNTKGFLIGGSQSSAADLGDEPMQYLSKFPDVTVAVCEDRVTGINKLKDDHDLIILDDAFQHRKVRPGFSILLFDYRSLFSTQFLLPSGNLREMFSGYKRADVVVVTKSPANITDQQKMICREKFHGNLAVNFSSIFYQSPVNLHDGTAIALQPGTSVILLTGIANPEPLTSYLKAIATIEKHFDFPDHYQFSKDDIVSVTEVFHALKEEPKIILTTEKDAQRLLTGTLNKLLVDLPVYIIPITITIHDESRVAFDNKIIEYVSSATRNG